MTTSAVTHLGGKASAPDDAPNHQANEFGGPISASHAAQWYISYGVPRHKVILGVPLYGRPFLNTDGPGTPFSGLGQGSWESGVYEYRALPLPGSHILRDERALASWTYDHVRKEMTSFDDEIVGRWKGEYIAREGLGGSMFWELSGDKGGTPREGMEGGHGKEAQPGRSLVRVVKDAMGELDTQPKVWEKARVVSCAADGYQSGTRVAVRNVGPGSLFSVTHVTRHRTRTSTSTATSSEQQYSVLGLELNLRCQQELPRAKLNLKYLNSCYGESE
ncbi:glycosyl hydrolases family 18-domain-containing protein [Lactarius quietus]|nr:glycosyl hydrolases family 18-domain-containing protein [Lactarius quietus]